MGVGSSENMCGISILSIEKVRSTLSDFRDLQERSENASSVDTCTRQHDRASRRFVCEMRG